MQIGAHSVLSTSFNRLKYKVSCYLHISDIIIRDGCFVVFIEWNYIRTTKQFTILQKLVTIHIHTIKYFEKCARFSVQTDFRMPKTNELNV